MDDVINVSGKRLGTAEVEDAMVSVFACRNHFFNNPALISYQIVLYKMIVPLGQSRGCGRNRCRWIPSPSKRRRLVTSNYI